MLQRSSRMHASDIARLWHSVHLPSKRVIASHASGTGNGPIINSTMDRLFLTFVAIFLTALMIVFVLSLYYPCNLKAYS
jgi:hypothetical protein